MERKNAVRKSFSYEMTVSKPPEFVFPLLCPKREYDWLNNWRCEMIYSESGLAEYNGVFTTDFLQEGKGLWVVSRYEPNQEIGFVITFVDAYIRKLDILVQPVDGGGSRLMWTTTFTAISDEGSAFVDDLTEDGNHERMNMIEQALTYYCDTGKMFRPKVGPLDRLQHHTRR